MMPRQSEIEIPILRTLVDLGGSANPKDLYNIVSLYFDLTDGDLRETNQSGELKWQNLVRWARQRLVEKGEVYSPRRGDWVITEKGMWRLLIESLDRNSLEYKISQRLNPFNKENLSSKAA